MRFAKSEFLETLRIVENKIGTRLASQHQNLRIDVSNLDYAKAAIAQAKAEALAEMLAVVREEIAYWESRIK